MKHNHAPTANLENRITSLTSVDCLPSKGLSSSDKVILRFSVSKSWVVATLRGFVFWKAYYDRLPDRGLSSHFPERGRKPRWSSPRDKPIRSLSSHFPERGRKPCADRGYRGGCGLSNHFPERGRKRELKKEKRKKKNEIIESLYIPSIQLQAMIASVFALPSSFFAFSSFPTTPEEDGNVWKLLAIATGETALQRSQTEDDGAVNRWLLKQFSQS